MSTATWEDASLPVYATAEELATVASANEWKLNNLPYGGRTGIRLVGDDETVIYQLLPSGAYRLVNVVPNE